MTITYEFEKGESESCNKTLCSSLILFPLSNSSNVEEVDIINDRYSYRFISISIVVDILCDICRFQANYVSLLQLKT
jgi:hypothetical protein